MSGCSGDHKWQKTGAKTTRLKKRERRERKTLQVCARCGTSELVTERDYRRPHGA